MEKEYRLRSNKDFKTVYNKGKSYWNRNLGIYVLKNNLQRSRIGFSITKKFGNSVTRNRTRRRISEICRQNFNNIREGYDIIIIPRKNVIDITHTQLKGSIFHIFKISRILKG
ncbi:MAG: ribonuclease P protein component [Tissierellia bacterium]|nr:ribonuclease P protein component [Tissierellia bacterium]